MTIVALRGHYAGMLKHVFQYCTYGRTSGTEIKETVSGGETVHYNGGSITVRLAE
jgi:hypothetical protein